VELLLEPPLLVPEELSEPGLVDPPVAEPGLRPKYENTLCLQPGWLRSVVASKVGADSSLELSPLKVKVGCWPEVLPAPVPLMLLEEGFNRAQGTATCLPPVEDAPEVLDEPGLEEPPEELKPPEELELLPKLLLELLPPEELLPGLVALPLLEPPLELSERIAKSTRPDMGLMMTSLMVPNSVPELPVTCAPVNWLARNSCRPMRPVGLKCPPVQPD